MPENNTQKYDATEKVERMNRIFDHVVLPAIAFTVIMFVISGIIIGPSCGGRSKQEQATSQSSSQQRFDAYLMREVLLEDMDGNRKIFEQGGYTLIETEQSGLVAHRQLDDHTQIFDNVADSSGGRYSAVMYEENDVLCTVRIYSESIFLVEAADDEKAASAIFRDERFTTWTSGSDIDAAQVLAIVPADRLCSLVEAYKSSVLQLMGE